MITVASEVMAILCLADDIEDLRRRLGNIIVAYNYDGAPVTAKDLKADGAMTLLLKEAIQPNLVQTLENTPCLMHGGPFANIAHGCNSVQATKLALKLADYVVTEAGFGADLGAEKFLDIKCRMAGLKPDMAVVVATVRALKYNGGIAKDQLKAENVEALQKGLPNLQKHIENMQKFGLPVVVALNVFDTDTASEIAAVQALCEKMDVPCARSEVFAKGGEGGVELAQCVLDTLDTKQSHFAPIYDVNSSIEDKILTLVREIYGGSGVVYTAKAKKQIKMLTDLGFDNLPICVAKTQYSLSDNPALLGRPEGFKITVSEVRVSAGAGFVVVQTGDIMTMPGLPKKPAAQILIFYRTARLSGCFDKVKKMVRKVEQYRVNSREETFKSHQNLQKRCIKEILFAFAVTLAQEKPHLFPAWRKGLDMKAIQAALPLL